MRPNEVKLELQTRGRATERVVRALSFTMDVPGVDEPPTVAFEIGRPLSEVPPGSAGRAADANAEQPRGGQPASLQLRAGLDGDLQ
jgi:hypothetical protein